MSEQELKEARDALAAAEQARDAAIAESRRNAEALLLREARDVVTEALVKAEVPDITKARLAELLAKNPPTKDGVLDRPALEEAVSAAVKAEAEYLAKVTGSGSVRGIGGTSSEAGLEEAQKRLGTAFGRLGLSEAETKQAIAGRSH